MIKNTTFIVSQNDAVKHLLSQQHLKGKVTKWIMPIEEFYLVYMHKKALKGQVIEYLLEKCNFQESTPCNEELRDEIIDFAQEEDEDKKWILYYDGSNYMRGVGGRIILINPQDQLIPITYKLAFDYTNNVVEYEELILGLKTALFIKVNNGKMYVDSHPLVN